MMGTNKPLFKSILVSLCQEHQMSQGKKKVDPWTNTPYIIKSYDQTFFRVRVKLYGTTRAKFILVSLWWEHRMFRQKKKEQIHGPTHYKTLNGIRKFTESHTFLCCTLLQIVIFYWCYCRLREGQQFLQQQNRSISLYRDRSKLFLTVVTREERETERMRMQGKNEWGAKYDVNK